MLTHTLSGRRIAIAGRSVRDYAGSSRIILGLARALTDQGHTVDVYGEHLDPDLIRRYGGTPRDALPPLMGLRIARRWLGRERLSAMATRRIRAGAHDLVIGNGTLLEQDVLLVHNVARREAEVLGDAGSMRDMTDTQDRLLTRGGFRLLVANSRLMKTELCRRYPLEPDLVTVIHPAVDPLQFRGPVDQGERDRLRTAFHFGTDQTVIGFITSGHYRLRGVDILAETIHRLPPEVRRTVRVLAIAARRNAELIQRAFAERGLSESLILTGKTGRVEDCYHAVDLLFHPARFETFGLVVAEAVACGCPVLTSTSVGAAELFTGDARVGVVEQPSPEAFLPVLERLVGDSVLRSAVAQAQSDDFREITWPAYTANLWAAVTTRGLA